MSNLDVRTVESFGYEWTEFDQSTLSDAELDALFASYFDIFPWQLLTEDSVGFDAGCGSGRWAKRVAPRLATLHCIDASEAAARAARRNLRDLPRCVVHVASIEAMPLADASMDMGYSLGVLHHVPDTAAGIAACVRKLKPGAPLLLYLYYALDNRPWWYRLLWHASDALRHLIAGLPNRVKYYFTGAIAAGVYWPLARTALLLEKIGCPVDALPLSFYRRRTFFVMRTDAFDRFATRLEKRFRADEIRAMMESAGLERIVFSPNPPYWRALGYRRRDA